MKGDGSSRKDDEVEVVVISYNDLVSACNSSSDGSSDVNLDDLIDKAFGASSNSLGIIAITDVPNLPSLRVKLLHMAQELATLPPDDLDKITAYEAGYQVGWSHGREKLEGDKLDLSKGSFYANPLTDDLADCMLKRRNNTMGDGDLLKWDESIQSAQSDEDLLKLAKSNPAFFAPNIWPTESIPELETAFKEAGEMVHKIGIMIARCCDSYVSSRVSVSVAFGSSNHYISANNSSASFSYPSSAQDIARTDWRKSFDTQNVAKHVFSTILQQTNPTLKIQTMMILTLAIGAAGITTTVLLRAFSLLSTLIPMDKLLSAQIHFRACT
jgi:hypothetical protein